MQPNKLDIQSIWDMVDSITKIQEFTIGIEQEQVWNIVKTVLSDLKDGLMPLLPPIVTDIE